MSNIILTGVPRSGTTLVCHLFNQLPGVVALHEPLEKSRWPQDTPHAQIVGDIGEFFAEMRHSIETKQVAISRHSDSTIVDDAKGDYPAWLRWLPNRFYGQSLFGGAVLRQSAETRGWIHFDGPADTLFIKQTGLFTALLPALSEQFPCFAIVRNPLAVLASWNSIRFGLQQGSIPAAERFDAALRTRLEQTRDRHARQLVILDWFFTQYHRHLTHGQVIKYEAIIENSSQALAQIIPEAHRLRPDLTSRNENPLYNRQLVKKLWQLLRDSDGAFRHYYTREDCERLFLALE